MTLSSPDDSLCGISPKKKVTSSSKLGNLLLLAFSLGGYLEWGTDSRTFLFTAELDILKRMSTEQQLMLHPLIVLPLVGQILLLTTLFQKKPRPYLTQSGILLLGALYGFIAFAGIISSNWCIMVSTLPFIVTGVMVFKQTFKQKKDPSTDLIG